MKQVAHSGAGPGELDASVELGLTAIETTELPLVACDARGRVALANAAARRLWGVDGQFPAPPAGGWFDHDPERPEVSDPLAAALAGADPVREWRTLTAADGQRREALLCARALPNGLGAVMTILSMDQEARRAERLRSYIGDLEMVIEVTRMLSEVSDPDEAASMICTVAVGATGAIALLLWELKGERLVLGHHETALPAGQLETLVEPAREGAGRVLSRPRTLIEHLEEPGVFTVWHEPLTSAGRTVGVLSILWCGTLADTERPAPLIGSLAHHAAVTIERAELLRRLGEAARTDALTGLANRRTWQERLEHELARAQRDQQPLSLVLIDIDHFKRYNDQHGHPEGDRLLHDAAQSWSQRLRKTDLLARIGGEEFAILLPGCAAEDVPSVANNLRTAMPHGQTCSLGAVTTDGLTSASELYAAADEALYRAKRSGRDRVEVAETRPLPRARGQQAA